MLKVLVNSVKKYFNKLREGRQSVKIHSDNNKEYYVVEVVSLNPTGFNNWKTAFISIDKIVINDGDGLKAYKYFNLETEEGQDNIDPESPLYKDRGGYAMSEDWTDIVIVAEVAKKEYGTPTIFPNWREIIGSDGFIYDSDARFLAFGVNVTEVDTKVDFLYEVEETTYNISNMNPGRLAELISMLPIKF